MKRAADDDGGAGSGAATALDWAFFVFSGLASIWFAGLLLVRGSLELGYIGFLVVFWVVLAYLVLPRVDRVLTQIFIPDYFMGRTRTSAGLFGDAVNLAFLGSEQQLRTALERTGWVLADPVTLTSSWRIVTSTLLHRSYLQAPVSPLLLFGRQQDFAYQQEVNGNPRQRHHVRFWRCPEGWLLPGGIATDWLGAASFDRAVGLSLFTLQVTHRVGENIDAERDYLVSSMQQAFPEVSVNVIKNFSTGYHSRNGGGDSIVTDGDLPVTNLTALPQTPAGGAASGNSPPSPNPVFSAQSGTEGRRIRRPPPVIFGAGLVFLRGLAALTVAAPFLARVTEVPWVSTLVNEVLGEQSSELANLGSAYAPASVTLAVFACVEAALAVFILRGSNAARVTAMFLSSGAIILQVAAVFSGSAFTLGSNLLGYSFDILLILALSSDRARVYARTQSHRRRRARILLAKQRRPLTG
ncbi:LssY C-terminal domain-containing protein [Arthrobacter gengyunqii]|uniref:LssY C-terminal domain-containing protein n=1 Tax=Arthrobacter gengyunqii TaxID=2886940 RepID=A0A9X1S904_9MICC|nr:LssY C-terminal domain-containing protein [Arthrobacter gengyunqii]MCC3270449.1 LssY C-terminal domain-containing protein [Arthrobacter gengyunqii]UOY97635.1 LssY C-terminal domain-containing protein [Arthrobacter gengyunqii]